MLATLVLSMALASSPDAEVRRTVHDALVLAHEGNFTELRTAANAKPLEIAIRGALRIRCVRVDGIVFERIVVDGATAVADVEVATSKSDRETPDAWKPIEATPLRITLDRDGQRWKLKAIEYPDDALAAALVAASPEEQDRLLRENERRLTKSLMRALDVIAVKKLNSPDYETVRPIAKLIRRVGALAADGNADALTTSFESTVTRRQGDRDGALRLARESVALAKKDGDADALSRTWRVLARSLGMFDTLTGEREEAQRLGLTYALRGEDPVTIARSFIGMAALAYDQRDFYSARRYLEQSVPFIRDGDDMVAEGDYRNMLTNVECAQGNVEMCRHWAERTLEFLKPDDWRVPWAQSSLATSEIRSGNLEKGREILLKAKSVLRPDNEIAPTINEQLGYIAAHQGKIDEAECLLREGAVMAERIGMKNGPLLNHITPMLADQGDYQRALRLSLEVASNTQSLLPDHTTDALRMAARAYRAIGMRDRALASARESITHIERQVEMISGGEQGYVQLSGYIAACYELTADLLLESGDVKDVKEALSLLERGRGHVLYDMIARGRPASAVELAAADRETREQYEARLSRANVALLRAESAGARDQIERLQKELTYARREYESFVDGLHSRDERRKESRRPLTIESLDDVLQQLPEDLAVIEYAVRDDEVEAFVVRRGEVSHRTIDIDRKSLEKKVENLAAMIATRDFRYAGAAKDLYALLIRPLEPALGTTSVVCIVPDDVLWRVPFAALKDARDRFLIERTAVFYVPSISVYVAMSKRAEDRVPERIVAVANPTLDTGMAKQVASFYRDVNLGPLPDAETEADSLREVYGASRCVVLKRDEATEARSKDEMTGAGILHFATHGVLDDRNPFYSRLLLGTDAGDDGSLEAWEIARLNLDADLVVLSACDTARGMIGGGEGIVGMTWSFFAAGARSTVATSWKIASRSTSGLMAAFHKALRAREGEPLAKARALRDGQLQSIRDEALRHPFYWAGFVLFGDGT